MRGFIKTAVLALFLVTLGGWTVNAQSIFVQFLGTSDGELIMIDTDGDGVDDTESLCFENDLVDPSTGLVVGHGLDCLRDITPVEGADGLILVSNIFFEFGEGNVISSEGTTTVQPILTQSGLDAGITNGTASFSDDDTVTFGTGIFEGATGSVRLSGQIDLTDFPNSAFFDCLFEIKLDDIPQPPITGGGMENIVVAFRGTSDGELTMIDTDGDGVEETESLCFENDLIDPSSGQVIGHGIDCLRDITPVEGTNGLTLVSNIFFTLDGFNGGIISSEGETTVEEILTMSALDAGFTNSTQSRSSVDTVTFGTGIFEGATGNARLSGLVDLTNFPNSAFFDCLFIISVQLASPPVEDGGSGGGSCSLAPVNQTNIGTTTANAVILFLIPMLYILGSRRFKKAADRT